MTGAGTATVAYGIESSFMGSLEDSDGDGNPEYYQPGKNVTIEEAQLSNELQRIHDPDCAESITSLAQNLEGAFSASWIPKHFTHHDWIFNDGGTGFTSGLAASSRWYLGLDYLSGTAERELVGVVPTQYQLDWTQGQAPRVSVTCIYGDENKAASITPSDIQDPGSVYTFHGADLDVDGVAQTKMQSAQLQISNIARFQRGADRQPLDAVIAGPETSLTASTIFTEVDQLQLAYGGGGSAVSSTQDEVPGVAGSFAFTNGAGTTTTFNLSEVTPDTYGWDDLVSGDTDADTQESVNYQVNGVTVS